MSGLPSVVYEVFPDAWVEGQPLLRAMLDKLEHLASLSVDALVLTPLFPAKDAWRLEPESYFRIDDALGDEEDLVALCRACEKRGIDVVVSGVFDHVSRGHEWFTSALAHQPDEGAFVPEERTRAYFSFGEGFPSGYACRDDDPEKPELNLKDPELRRRLFTGESSVFHHWLDLGVRGWRILRADALGYSILRESSRASRSALGNHFVVGDVRGFADRYVKDGILDGVVGHYPREACLSYLRGQVPARQLARVWRDLATRYGAAHTGGWNLLSIGNETRAATVLNDRGRLRLGVLLSYTLPGAAHVLFGDEVGGLTGGRMNWRESRWDGELLAQHRALGALRRSRRGLLRGDFVDLTPEGEDEIFAFARATQDPRDTVVVVVNRASQTRVRKLFAPVSDLPDGLVLRDLDWSGQDFSGQGAVVRSGSIHLEVEGQAARVLVPDEESGSGARSFRGY